MTTVKEGIEILTGMTTVNILVILVLVLVGVVAWILFSIVLDIRLKMRKKKLSSSVSQSSSVTSSTSAEAPTGFLTTQRILADEEIEMIEKSFRNPTKPVATILAMKELVKKVDMYGNTLFVEEYKEQKPVEEGPCELLGRKLRMPNGHT